LMKMLLLWAVVEGLIDLDVVDKWLNMLEGYF